MAVFNVLFFMAQVLPKWKREMIRHEIAYTSEQDKLKADGERLITLTTQVQHQSQTIETMTNKINTCERTIETLTNKINTCESFNTQLMETNMNLRKDNTELHRKCTKSDAEIFQLRHAYQYLEQEYHEPKNSYLETYKIAHRPKTP